MNERLLWTTGQQMRVEAGSPSGGGPKPKQWGVGAQGSPLTTLQSHTAQTTDRCREWRGSALWREQAESTPSPTGPWGPHPPPPSCCPQQGSGLWPQSAGTQRQPRGGDPSTPPLLAPRPTSTTSGSSTWQASSWPTMPRLCPCWPLIPLRTGPPPGKILLPHGTPPTVASAASQGCSPKCRRCSGGQAPISWKRAGVHRSAGPQVTPFPQHHSPAERARTSGGGAGRLQQALAPRPAGLRGPPFLESCWPASPGPGPGCGGAPRGPLWLP